MRPVSFIRLLCPTVHDTGLLNCTLRRNCMSNYSYIAVDPAGSETRGTLDVSDQSEALRRIKEMGLFPTRVSEARKVERNRSRLQARSRPRAKFPFHFGGRVKRKVLTTFTR